MQSESLAGWDEPLESGIESHFAGSNQLGTPRTSSNSQDRGSLPSFNLSSNPMRTLILPITIAVVFAASGCSGGGSTEVSGKVTLQGKPLPEGSIRFVPTVGTKGRPGSAVVTNGTYTIPLKDGMVPGKYKVEITARRKTGKKVPVPDSPGVERDEEEEYIPIQFNLNTTLEAELAAGSNTKDFNLEGVPASSPSPSTPSAPVRPPAAGAFVPPPG